MVEALPLTADDIYSVRSAHGSFANVLQVWGVEQAVLGIRGVLWNLVCMMQSAHGSFASVLQVCGIGAGALLPRAKSQHERNACGGFATRCKAGLEEMGRAI